MHVNKFLVHLFTHLFMNFFIYSRISLISKPVGATSMKTKNVKRKILFPFHTAQVIIKDGLLRKRLNWTHITRKATLDMYAIRGKR